MQTLDARQMPMGTQLALQERDGQPKTREVRLGLVMYGGVSLAIYINGGAHEFFRAVQGEGVYRLLKALTDADIVVDVISGTSAGGVNGILLAYALCNGKDFGSAAALWRQHGGIKDLLRSPYADTTSSSFLDSEGHYQPRLQEAFTAMHDRHPAAHDMPSAFNELDLFITGTDVDGRLYTQLDVLVHEVPTVITDALDEQHEWEPVSSACETATAQTRDRQHGHQRCGATLGLRPVAPVSRPSCIQPNEYRARPCSHGAPDGLRWNSAAAP